MINYCCEAAYEAMRKHYGPDPNDTWKPEMVAKAIHRDVHNTLAGATPEQLHEAWRNRQIAAGAAKRARRSRGPRNPTLAPWAHLSLADQLGFCLFVDTVQNARPQFHAKLLYCSNAAQSVMQAYIGTVLGQTVPWSEDAGGSEITPYYYHAGLVMNGAGAQQLHQAWYEVVVAEGRTWGPDRTDNTSPACKPWSELPMTEKYKFLILRQAIAGAAEHFEEVISSGGLFEPRVDHLIEVMHRHERE
jgi:hypothetical protein